MICEMCLRETQTKNSIYMKVDIIYAIIRNGFSGFLHMFLPSGVPVLIAPLIFVLEILLLGFSGII